MVMAEPNDEQQAFIKSKTYMKWKWIEKSGRRVAYGVVVKWVHATWGVVATKMSEWPPLESLTPLKIRPSQEDSNLTHFSQNLCRVTFLIKINISNTMR